MIKRVADASHHPSMSFCTLFSRHETTTAFAALEHLRFFECAPSIFHAHQRRGSSHHLPPKMELSASLCRMWEASERDVPPPLLHVFQGLEAAAMDFAHKAMLHPSILESARSDFLKDIGRRSVFRIWRYSAGCGCRPHYDPGLCTALLLHASAPGLEVNLREKLPPLLPFPGGSDGGEMDGDRAMGMEALTGWEDPGTHTDGVEDTLVLASNMMHVVSGGILPAVLHRVRSDWAEGGGGVRYNFVVELRPAEPRRWYRLAIERLQQ